MCVYVSGSVSTPLGDICVCSVPASGGILLYLFWTFVHIEVFEDRSFQLLLLNFYRIANRSLQFSSRSLDL